MTFDELASLGELLGGIGVIVSVIYLAFQIRRNSKIVNLNNLHHTLDASRQNFLASTQSNELLDVLVKSSNNESLNEAESIRYRFWVLSQIRNFENTYLQYIHGALDKEVIDAIESKLELASSTDSFVKVWESNRLQSVESFRVWADEIVDRRDG